MEHESQRPSRAEDSEAGGTFDEQFLTLKRDVSNRICALEAALRLKDDKLQKVDEENRKLADKRRSINQSLSATIDQLKSQLEDQHLARMKEIKLMANVLAENHALKRDLKEKKDEIVQYEEENHKLMTEKASFSNRLKAMLNDMSTVEGTSSDTTIELSEASNNKRPNESALADEISPARKQQKTVDEQPILLNPTIELNDVSFQEPFVEDLQSVSDDVTSLTSDENSLDTSTTTIEISETDGSDDVTSETNGEDSLDTTTSDDVERNEDEHVESDRLTLEKRKIVRKNINKVMNFESLTLPTKIAFQEENERKKRYTRKLQTYCKTYGVLPGEFNKMEKLVLDFDANSKRELLAVDTKLLTKLKPHQCEGVKFMWDACFESIETLQRSDGGGCILGHCMGLGKTLQVITLVHTLMTHSDQTKVEKVLIICPKNVILNWVDEFELWLKDFQNKANVYHLSSCSFPESSKRIKAWHKNGGVFIMGYRSFQTWSTTYGERSIFHSAFTNPGADFVICDEGHLLKNPKSKMCIEINRIHTLRRVILTGSPLQNNLNEYFTMIEIVKPRLLGTAKEFKNRFVGPIMNGQFIDSTEDDITIMKYRSCILHKLLDGCIQRRNYSVLAEFLPPKQEFVLFIRLTKIQMDLYKFYLTTHRRKNPIVHLPQLKKICNHPNALIDFANQTSWNSNVESKDNESNEISDQWWKTMFNGSDQQEVSGKTLILFSILAECKARGDKLLVFSGCLSTLNVIETFLQQKNLSTKCETWIRGLDYLRMDGSTSVDKRKQAIEVFNDDTNKRARLFLISTKAGSLGVNLTAANRVVIFDASWNPSDDIQSIFRTYRIGQKKECFVYRFIALGTMEEKMYDRQVTKLSISKRVIDEQQIGRYYKEKDLQQLFGVDDLDPTVQAESPIMADDTVLTALLEKHSNAIFRCHDHDSLLVEMKDEILTNEEIGDVWDEFESFGIDDFVGEV